MIPYLTRVLGPREFGIYAGCLTVHGFMLMVAADPTTGTLKRWYGHSTLRGSADVLIRGLLGLSLALIVGMALVATIAILLTTSLTGFHPWRAPLLATVTFTAAFTLFQYLLTIQYVQELAARGATAQIAHALAKAAAIAVGAGIFATATASFLAYSMVLVGLCAWLYKLAGPGRRRPEHDAAIWSDGIRYGGPLILVSASFVVLAGLDRLILAGTAGLTEAGRYAAAYLIADGAVSLPAMLLHYAAYTSIVSAWEAGDLEAAQRVQERTVDVLIIFGVTVVFAFAVVGEDVVRLLSGAAFSVSSQVLVVISASLLLYRIGTFEAVGYHLRLETGRLAATYGSAALVCGPVTTAAILLWDLAGAAIGTAVSYLVFLLLIRARSPCRATTRYPSRKLALALACMPVALGVAYMLD